MYSLNFETLNWSLIAVILFIETLVHSNLSVKLMHKIFSKKLTDSSTIDNDSTLHWTETLTLRNIFVTWLCRPLIFQTLTVWLIRNQSLKYQRSTISGCKGLRIKKLEVERKMFSSFLNIIENQHTQGRPHLRITNTGN